MQGLAQFVEVARGEDMCGILLFNSSEDYSYVCILQTVNLRLAHALQLMNVYVVALP